MKWLVGVAAMLIAGATQAAEEAPPCAPRDSVLAMLDKEFHQRPAHMGLTSGGNLVEILTTEDGDRWTALQTLPNGTTCFLATGRAWLTDQPSENDSFVVTAPDGRGNGVRIVTPSEKPAS